MMKKIFAVALAATMTIASAVSAFAATTITGAWWTAWTPAYEVADTAEFDIEVKGGASAWNNISAVFVNKQTTGTVAPHTEIEGYKEYAVVRADSWGWGGGDNMSCDGKAIVYQNDITEEAWVEYLIATMADAHIDATITKTATGATLHYDVTGANGNAFKYDVTVEADMSEGLYVFFACDGSEVTVTPVEATADAPAEDTTDAPAEDGEVATTAKPATNTGDATTTAGIAVVAFAAAAAVVVLRKRAINE